MTHTVKVRGAFFYNPTENKLSQAKTILKVLDELEDNGIILHCHPTLTCTDVQENIRGDDEFILMAGKCSKSADHPLTSMLSQGLPVFAIIRGASSSFGNSAQHRLEDDRLTTLIRNTNLLDLELNNTVSKTIKSRYHAKLINEVDGKVTYGARESLVTQEHLAKVFTGYSIATYPRLDSLVEAQLQLNQDRPIDISFVGSANYGTPEISRHRQLAVRTLEEMTSPELNIHLACTRSRNNQTAVKYNLKEFYAVLGKSKIVLSPWGLGEVCIRDFEIMLSGGLMIKPDMSHIETNPPFYRAGETYLSCRRDFSDLPEIVNEVLENWGQYNHIREEAYNVVINSREPQFVAKQVANLIYDGLKIHQTKQ
ncbi:MAG: glycosyltransferase family 1 protein [Arenicella sp.]|nr:glycosyltransferase family 1 protein [Arenicella sp.]